MPASGVKAGCQRRPPSLTWIQDKACSGSGTGLPSRFETEGLVGGSYLSVGRKSDASPTAGPGGTIHSKEPFEIADLMQQMGDTAQKGSDAIDDMKGDVERAVVSGADTIDSANADS